MAAGDGRAVNQAHQRAYISVERHAGSGDLSAMHICPHRVFVAPGLLVAAYKGGEAMGGNWGSLEAYPNQGRKLWLLEAVPRTLGELWEGGVAI